MSFVCASLVWTLRRLGLNSGVRNLKTTQIKTPLSAGAFLCGPPGEIRTPDTQVRSLVLYPAELRAEARSLGLRYLKVKTKHRKLSCRRQGQAVRDVGVECGAKAPT